MSEKTIFEPYAMDSLWLANHILIAPLTHSRAGIGLAPSELARPTTPSVPVLALHQNPFIKNQ